MKEELILSLFRFKFRMTVVLLLLMMLLAACVYNAGRDSLDRSTVANFNLDNFMGRWYEIARFDHSFERGLDYTEAEYTLRSDGDIDVVNTGLAHNKRKTSEGRAKLTDTPALLRVSFFRPFYSDYRVMMVDSAYQYALIGSGSDNYLWILARKPQLAEEVKATIVAEAQRRGYDTSKLLWVKQQNTVR